MDSFMYVCNQWFSYVENELLAKLHKNKSQEEEEDDFEGIISKEELRKLDSQPNPFNFSDRVSQTIKALTVVSGPCWHEYCH